MQKKRRIKVIPDKLFEKLWNEALRDETLEIFIKKFLSPASNERIDFQKKYGIDILTAREILERIYDAANMEIRQIIELSGKRPSQIRSIFCIPRRTLEDWCSGKNKANGYVKLMMIRQFHLLDLGKYIYLESELEYLNSRKRVYKKKDMDDDTDSVNLENYNIDSEEDKEFEKLLQGIVSDHTDTLNSFIKKQKENEEIKSILEKTDYLKKMY